MVKIIRETIIPRDVTLRTLLADMGLMVVTFLLPTISHLTAFPLYRLNPMLLMVVGARVLGGSRANAYLLAVALPLVSTLLVGMPAPGKGLCMVAEYLTMIAVFDAMTKRFGSLWGLAAGLLSSKAVFYLLFGICC